jgi:hypothetical protein
MSNPDIAMYSPCRVRLHSSCERNPSFSLDVLNICSPLKPPYMQLRTENRSHEFENLCWQQPHSTCISLTDPNNLHGLTDCSNVSTTYLEKLLSDKTKSRVSPIDVSGKMSGLPRNISNRHSVSNTSKSAELPITYSSVI